MSDIKTILGENIRKLRIQAGWTQEKLAEKSDISVPFMTQIELARKSASLEVIQRIANALHVSYDQLFKANPLNHQIEMQNNLHVFENNLIQSITDVVQEKFNTLVL